MRTSRFLADPVNKKKGGLEIRKKTIARETDFSLSTSSSSLTILSSENTQIEIVYNLQMVTLKTLNIFKCFYFSLLIINISVSVAVSVSANRTSVHVCIFLIQTQKINDIIRITPMIYRKPNDIDITPITIDPIQ